jgi:hypothetical protein
MSADELNKESSEMCQETEAQTPLTSGINNNNKNEEVK